MLLTLDDRACTDPSLVGAKAAWLAKARQAGFPVMDGVVVSAVLSQAAMRTGVETMGTRGSGGARLAIIGGEMPEGLAEALVMAVDALDDPLVVRSSTTLEASGSWSGAFTSYLDIGRSEIATAVRGCWASAFTVHALERYRAAGLEPGSVPMAVLIQPRLEPDFGGTARISGDDVLVVAVEGSPASLVQGWEPGVYARAGADHMTGDAAIELLGEDLLSMIVAALRDANQALGATSCEWGSVDGRVTFFQLMRSPTHETQRTTVPAELSSPEAARVAMIVRRAPGPMGETLVIPWSLGCDVDIHDLDEPLDLDPVDALGAAIEQAGALTAEVWGRSRPNAASVAQETIRSLRGDNPQEALETVRDLRPVEWERASEILRLLATVRHGLVRTGAVSQPELGWHIEPSTARRILSAGAVERRIERIGFDRWEPFDVSVVMAQGRWADGTPAAPGVAAGRLCFIADVADTRHFRARDVVVSRYPLPNLAALLWDAAAIVTTGGGPAAHLFESARALAIPAVCAIHLDDALGMGLDEADGRMSMAVDGDGGRVAVMAW